MTGAVNFLAYYCQLIAQLQNSAFQLSIRKRVKGMMSTLEKKTDENHCEI